MTNPSAKKKPGPVSFASKISTRPQPTPPPPAPEIPVEPLWTTKEIGRYLRMNKNALCEFLKRTPDFPAFKLGSSVASQWRADPEAVKEWVRRQRVQSALEHPQTH